MPARQTPYASAPPMWVFQFSSGSRPPAEDRYAGYAGPWTVSNIGQPISVLQACSSPVSWRPTR
jgi:hypothetical protein